jgi:hypothetical protein
MVYQIPPVSMLLPAADAAGRTSTYFNLRNSVGKAYVVVTINQGNAATVLLSLLQATSLAGAGSKAISAGASVYLCNATATSDAYTQPNAGNAATYTTDATLAGKKVVFELELEACLDMINGFYYLAVSTGASNAANITVADLFLLQSIQGASAPTTMV